MPPSSRPTLLVIPAFRESRRLPRFLPRLCEAIAELDRDQLEILVVDDGSGENEQKVITDLVASLRESHPFLREPLLLDKNRGKGGAVYAGWDSVIGEKFETLGFVDADGAINAAEVARVTKKIPTKAADECLYAARLHDADQAIQRTLLRKWLGLLFRRITRVFFRFPIDDTQCGFKYIPAKNYYATRKNLTELRYCFDIDLTIHLLKEDVTISEVPISWRETPGTKLTLSQAANMLRSLWELRKKVS